MSRRNSPPETPPVSLADVQAYGPALTTAARELRHRARERRAFFEPVAAGLLDEAAGEIERLRVLLIVEAGEEVPGHPKSLGPESHRTASKVEIDGRCGKTFEQESDRCR